MSTAISMSTPVDKLNTDTKTLDGTLKRYLTAGKKMEAALVQIEGYLNIPSKVESDLKKIDKPLTTLRQLLLVVELVPQTAIQSAAKGARKLIRELLIPVKKAERSLKAFDTKIKPIKTVVGKAKGVVKQFNTAVDEFEKGLAKFTAGVNQAQTCITALPSGSTKTSLQEDLDGVAVASDKRVVQLNGLLVSAIDAANGTAVYVKNTLDPLFQPFRDLEKAIDDLKKRLDPLLQPLRDLKKLMDKKISFSFPYPDGWTWVDGYYNSWGIWVPGHWLPKFSWYPVSFTISQILDGFEDFKKRLERILSAFLMRIITALGLKSIFDRLKAEADKIIGALVSQIKILLDELDIKIPFIDDVKDFIAAVQAKLDEFKGMITIAVTPMTNLMKQIQKDVAAFKNVYDECTKTPK